MKARHPRRVVLTAPRRCELLADEGGGGEPGPGEVAARSVVSLVSPGTELAMFDAEQFPKQPGYATVLEVEGAGPSVEAVARGTLALAMVPHRSHHLLAAGDALPLPSGLAADVAVFARIMAVSMTSLALTAARAPAHVAVIGLGLVGHMAAQTWRAAGYTVHGWDVDEARRSPARAHGIDVRKLTTFAPEVVLECSGHELAVQHAADCVRPGGEVFLIGVPWRRRADLQAHALLHTIFHRHVALRGGWEWQIPLRPAANGGPSVHTNLSSAMEWLRDGRVRVDGLAARVAPSALPDWYAGTARPASSLSALIDWSLD